MTSPATRTRLIRRGGKKVREHRWLMEQELGRKLLPTEHVHHRNGNPLDNRLENLHGDRMRRLIAFLFRRRRPLPPPADEEATGTHDPYLEGLIR